MDYSTFALARGLNNKVDNESCLDGVHDEVADNKRSATDMEMSSSKRERERERERKRELWGGYHAHACLPRMEEWLVILAGRRLHGSEVSHSVERIGPAQCGAKGGHQPS